ncbi:MAG: hypothetical protein QOH35_1596 [Acidobacteriaceae bacterium]|nr:hypothetical protein [Acidobacteriaceae bacterium]
MLSGTKRMVPRFRDSCASEGLGLFLYHDHSSCSAAVLLGNQCECNPTDTPTWLGEPYVPGSAFSAQPRSPPLCYIASTIGMGPPGNDLKIH